MVERVGECCGLRASRDADAGTVTDVRGCCPAREPRGGDGSAEHRSIRGGGLALAADMGRAGAVRVGDPRLPRRVGFQTAARGRVSVAFISHPDCGRHDTGWGHPEHVGRLRAIPRALRDHLDLFQRLVHCEGRYATEDELLIAHDPRYVTVVREMAAAGGGHLDPDTVVSDGSWAAASAAVGCVFDAVDMAFDGRSVR